VHTGYIIGIHMVPNADLESAGTKALPLSTAWLPTKAHADITNVLTMDEARRLRSA
jgi:hypothetical protein